MKTVYLNVPYRGTMVKTITVPDHFTKQQAAAAFNEGGHDFITDAVCDEITHVYNAVPQTNPPREPGG